MRDLGVIFDSKLTFKEHIESVVKMSYSMLGFIMRTTAKFNDLSCTNLLYNASVRYRLEYNCTVWNPHNVTYIENIERVQRKYTRQVFFNLGYEYTTYDQRTKILKITKLKDRREYFDICLLHKIIHDTSITIEPRPVFRVGRFANRTNICFNPQTPHNNSGLHTNPSIRLQLLYNRKFKNKIRKELLKQ
ncbi:hypothetical protein EON73_03570 [bacterium]|nr:MAG: hypothetical protein EON73_03570 [bacterium]